LLLQCAPSISKSNIPASSTSPISLDLFVVPPKFPNQTLRRLPRLPSLLIYLLCPLNFQIKHYSVFHVSHLS
jgi:hypothetical protein